MRNLSLVILLLTSLLHAQQRRPPAITLPGAKTQGPVTLSRSNPSGEVEITLDADEEASFFDIVITDPKANVRMTLPDGRRIDENVDPRGDITWTKLNRAADIDTPDFRLSPFLLPGEGTHHVLAFGKADRGVYRIRAETTGAASVLLTARFIPFVRALDDAISRLSDVPPGEVILGISPLPYECFEGDQLDLVASFRGDPVSEEVRFEVRLEYQDILPRDSRKLRQFGPPTIEQVPILFTRGSDGTYRGRLIPRRAGLLRVRIRASGTTTSGLPFSKEANSGRFEVHREVAKLTSLSETAVDTDGSGTLDRLDVTARLDVVIPGRYSMQFRIEDSSQSGRFARSEQDLSAGDQGLTASISANDLRKNFADGPWKISNLGISLLLDRLDADPVQVDQTRTLLTADYKRDQWDRGPAWIGESVTARGIRPAASGRFRMIEFQWPVFTPGGKCQWGLSLEEEYFFASGTLPKGAVTLNLVVDAARLAAASKKDWSVNPIVNCDFPVRDDFKGSLRMISLDPAQFESKTEPFHVGVHPMLRMASGQSAVTGADVSGKTVDEVSFEVTGAAPGIQLDVPARGQQAGRNVYIFVHVQIAPGTASGRYFLPITATSNGKSATSDLVIDVVE